MRPEATLTKLTYVDVHYTINGAAPVNVNMRSRDDLNYELAELKLNPGYAMAFRGLFVTHRLICVCVCVLLCV